MFIATVFSRTAKLRRSGMFMATRLRSACSASSGPESNVYEGRIFDNLITMPMRHAAKNRGPNIPARIHAVQQAIPLEPDVGHNRRAAIL